jgi:hypothetical protein
VVGIESPDNPFVMREDFNQRQGRVARKKWLDKPKMYIQTPIGLARLYEQPVASKELHRASK